MPPKKVVKSTGKDSCCDDDCCKESECCTQDVCTSKCYCKGGLLVLLGVLGLLQYFNVVNLSFMYWAVFEPVLVLILGVLVLLGVCCRCFGKK